MKVLPFPHHQRVSHLKSPDDYQSEYNRSLRDPAAFWNEKAQVVSWFQPYHTVKNVSFEKPVYIRWYEGGKLNVTFNCIDRHLPALAEKTAIIWEPDEPSTHAKHITYQQLSEEVGRLANVLKSMGIKKGDTVSIYMPMIPEAAYAMLACARIGAVHSVVFGGFAPDSLADRINDCESKLVITADQGVRGGKTVALKENVDKAVAKCPTVQSVLVARHTGMQTNMVAGRDYWMQDLMLLSETECPPEEMDAEDPLFILYTSGSTARPKGIVHTTGGYLVYATHTFQTVFDHHPMDVYWCTADVGWITGHSYLLYGPLASGATTLMFEGIPTYPSPSRFWQVIDKHQVSVFYTAPTALRSLMREGDQHVTACSRQSLRLLGSVGEPINPEAWNWYHRVIGDGRCPIVDTWWQTETGGILISPIPNVTELKAGSATYPLPGIIAELLDDQGQVLVGEGSGHLCIRDSWPGQARTIFKDPARFEETYFSTHPGRYFTGDGCRRDKDGYLWITGRVDDVLNVAGHRLSTAEVESALITHPAVAESGVVACPHPVKGHGIYCFVTLKAGVTPTDALKEDIKMAVRNEIGAIATPEYIHWAPQLPKTRSGKIMRRILRKIAENDVSQLGDTSTLTDPNVVTQLLEECPPGVTPVGAEQFLTGKKVA